MLKVVSYEGRWKEAEYDIKILRDWEEMRITPQEALEKYNMRHCDKPLTLEEFTKMALGLGYNRARYFMEHR